jgi:hypothetical protein
MQKSKTAARAQVALFATVFARLSPASQWADRRSPTIGSIGAEGRLPKKAILG